MSLASLAAVGQPMIRAPSQPGAAGNGEGKRKAVEGLLICR
jgi:hypothetical protein